jgi:p-cumate 2,3-dioxygenase subunit alpha
VGGRPVFMVRGVKTGNVNVFHNTCTHRGALVCRQDSGNSKVFQCFYHAWTFDSEGRLKGVPDRDAYADGVNFDELGLKRVACVESYRGFVFASFDPEIQDLPSYLAGAKDYIDLVVDGCGGSVEISTATTRNPRTTPTSSTWCRSAPICAAASAAGRSTSATAMA